MGWAIAGGVLAVLILLLLCPFSAQIFWKEELELRLRWLFWKKTIFPREKKPKTPEQEAKEAAKKAAKEEAKQKKEKKKFSVEQLEEIIGYIQAATGGLRVILKDLRVSYLELDWRISGDDPAETGIRYGRACAYLSGVIATLRNYIRIRQVKCLVRPSFIGEEEYLSLQARLSVTPLITLLGLLRIGWDILMRMLKSPAPASGAPRKRHKGKKAAAKPVSAKG